MTGNYKNFVYRIKKENGKYKPLTSINIGVTLPISIEGYNIQYAENKYLVSLSLQDAEVLAKKLIDQIMKDIE